MSKTDGFREHERSFTGHYGRTVFETLKFAYSAFLVRIVVCLILGFVGRGLLLSNANLIGWWVDSIIATSCSAADTTCRPPPAGLAEFSHTQFLALLLAFCTVGFALTLVFRIGFSRLSARAVSLIYDETTLRTSRFRMSFFDGSPAGRIITRFSTDYGNVFRLFGGPLAEFISIIFDLTWMILLIGVASPWYLPIVIAIAFLSHLVYRFNRPRLRTERRDLSANRSPGIAHFAETAQGAGTIRAFLRQSSFSERFSKLNDLYLNQKLRTVASILSFSLQMNILTAVLLLATGLAAWFLTREALVSVGSVGVAFSFIVLSGNTMQMFFEWLAQFEEAMVGVERMDDYLRRPLEPGLKLPATARFPTHHPLHTAEDELRLRQTRITQDRSASVKVEDLWLRYRPELEAVLKGVTFEIRPGERLGIVGRTGSGKTSLIQALFHLYPSEKGRISLNGFTPDLGEKTAADAVAEGLKPIDLTVFREAIGFIAQDPVLFKGTVRENLSLSESSNDDRLLEALGRVGLDDWIQQIPGGLDGLIEERGRNVSAGERQLICMARCLLQDAPVVIMDEATSAIDPRSEEILIRATHDFFADRTQIIIAHRLSTLAHCHRILWLHNGEIRMLGTPDEVLPVFERATLSENLRAV